jgi:threonine dehydratase
LAEEVRRETLIAEEKIRKYIRETPVEHSLFLSQLGSCNVYLKCENLQLTGSFKLRGALNKLLSFSKEELERGLMTASSGNHGAAFAWLMKRFNLKGTIILPETIPPYNDPQIIGGQGTAGIELIKQIPGVDCVIVPVGGGGLIAGIAGYLKSENLDIEIIGCQPENSAVMYQSIKAGKILDLESKDDFVLLTEDEIISALKLILEKHYLLVEGAAALSVAAFIKQIARFEGKNVVLVLSGSKISLEILKKILSFPDIL